jgi:hypothetical protein
MARARGQHLTRLYTRYMSHPTAAIALDYTKVNYLLIGIAHVLKQLKVSSTRRGIPGSLTNGPLVSSRANPKPPPHYRFILLVVDLFNILTFA